MSVEQVEQVEQQEQQVPPVEQQQEQPDGPGSGRSELRKQLEKGFADSRKAEERDRSKDGKFNKGKQPQQRAVDQYREGTEGEETQESQPQESQTKPPEAWAKEAKAEWANVPAAVQQAILKREDDSNKGVEELKKKYADVDAALAPRMGVIKQFGHTPAQAVNQLFAWFEALSQDVERLKQGQPAMAFQALAQSFGIDPKLIYGAPQQQQQQQEKPEERQEAKTKQEEIPTPVQNYISTLEKKLGELQNAISQKIGALETSFSAQSQAKTEEILANWAKDKPYFEDVRQLMGRLIASHAVAPLPNGSADLDKAYEMALYALPDIRAKVLAEQAAKVEAERKAKLDAEKKAQQDAANKARKAAGGLAPNAPGAPGSQQQKAAKKSVRESLQEAIDQARSN